MSLFGGNTTPLYDSIPSSKIQVEELEELLNCRFNILTAIDFKFQTDKNVKLTHFLNDNEKKIGWTEKIENDKISHYILSLALCNTEQDRNWFIQNETRLFVQRIHHYNLNFEEVLKPFNIPLEREDNISEAMLEKIKFKNENKNNSATFRIPFEYALNLFPSMNYYLSRGFVYITYSEIPQLIETVFKESILKKLNLINRNLERILSDSRIKSVINTFHTKREIETLSKNPSSTNIDNISWKEVDPLAEKAFPLCMQLLNKNLTYDGHLKHWGRLQYGLFLKGIGLSLDDSLSFWRNKFSKKTPLDKFEKEYSYNIRHSYGKEGKRNDYIPYSCNKIQVNLPAPSSGDHHGCPFKIYSEDRLKSMLYEFKFKELDVLKVLEKVRNKEYSVLIF
jgi:DNA primase large subunit